MATTDLVTRLTLNARQFTSQFDSAINQATAKARTGGRVIGESFSGAANAGLNEFANRIPIVGGAIGVLGPVALGAAAGVGALSAALAIGIGEAEKYGQQTAKLDAVLKATGNSTGFTAQQLRAAADELQNITAIDAEDFLAAERQLATFGGVAGSVFRDVITLSSDLSATFGGDVVSNTEKLGLAMQGLAEGNVQPLSRAFKFLGSDTLETIKALAEQGDAFEAQQALIDALRSRIGGTGAVAGDNLTGDLYRLRDAFDATAQSVAEGSGAYDGWRAGVQGVTRDVNNLLERLRNLPSGDVIAEAAIQGARFVATRSPLPGLTAGFATIGALPLPSNTPRARPGFGVADGANQFPGGAVDFDALGAAAEQGVARAAAAAASAESRKRRDAEGAAKALAEQRKSGEAAAKATQAQANALNASLADLQFAAQIAGKSREEAQRLTVLRNLERQYGPLITEQVQLQALAFLAMAEHAKEIAEARTGMLDEFRASAQSGFVASTAAANDNGMAQAVQDFARATTMFGADVPKLGTAFDRFNLSLKDFVTDLEQSLENVAGSFADRAINQTIGRVFDAAFKPIQAGLDFVLGPLERSSGVGALAGAAVGFKAGGPLGALIGAFAGGTFEGLVGGRDDFSGATLGTANGRITASGLVARGDGQLEQAQSLAGGFAQSLNNLAAALGSTLVDGANLGTIGTNKNAFVFNATGTSTAAGRGGQRFATAEQAVEAALRNAIAQGAVAGVDASVARLLGQGDLQVQTAKAAALANALRGFDEAANPFGVQVRALQDEFSKLRDIMIEAGSSTADLNRASADYDRRLQQIRESAGQATSTLRGFLDGLGFGSASPLALGSQRDSARAAFDAQAARIGSAGFDQNAFTAAGQRVLDIEGQLFGRTDSFFATFEQVQADTRRAIAAIDRAAALNGENPFARATAAATEATAENTASIAERLNSLPELIADQLAAAMAAMGIGSNGDGRGFVTRMAA